MAWRNSEAAFGSVAKLFHWIMALAIVVAYVVVYYEIWVVNPETSVKPAPFGILPDAERIVPVLNVHWILGTLVGVLVLPRLLWRLYGVEPKPYSERRIEILAARFAHWLLYSAMIVMPLTGWLMTHHGADFGMFAVTPFKDSSLFAWLASTFGLRLEDVEVPTERLHRLLGVWLMGPLVVLHVAAALHHHLIRGDSTLLRMLPGRRAAACEPETATGPRGAP